MIGCILKSCSKDGPKIRQRYQHMPPGCRRLQVASIDLLDETVDGHPEQRGILLHRIPRRNRAAMMREQGGVHIDAAQAGCRQGLGVEYLVEVERYDQIGLALLEHRAGLSCVEVVDDRGRNAVVFTETGDRCGLRCGRPGPELA